MVFSRYALKALVDRNAEVVGVFTIDESLQKGVSDFATFDDLVEGKKIPIYRFNNLHTSDAIQKLKELKPDLLYVIGWSWLLRKEILELPTRGVIGFHPTLLPEGRGRAPIPWTILKGLRKSGVTLFYLTEKADAGDIIQQIVFNIDPKVTATMLYQKVCEQTYEIVSKTFPLLSSGKEKRIKQDETKATYWTKRRPEDGRICWENTSDCIDALVRAVTHPYPGAFSYCHGEKVFIWEASPVLSRVGGTPGEVVDFKGEKALIQTADGALLLHSIQFEGFSKDLKKGDQFCA